MKMDGQQIVLGTAGHLPGLNGVVYLSTGLLFGVSLFLTFGLIKVNYFLL
jgi:hypothetical protein